jgi:uncharacterized protein (DUF1778 family)
MGDRKNSEARIRANNKYNAKAYDRINLAVPKGRKATIQNHAAMKGESINGFVNRAIAETMDHDKESGDAFYLDSGDTICLDKVAEPDASIYNAEKHADKKMSVQPGDIMEYAEEE